MAATTPDGLTYPTDPNAPADVITDIRNLATTTQTAFNNHMDVALATGNFTLSSGWVGDVGTGAPLAQKTGRVCITRGSAVRQSTVLAVTDNTTFQIATIPAGYRPAINLRLPAVWYGTDSGGKPNYSVALLTVLSNGTVSFTPNFTGEFQVNQWISFAGLSWVTP